VKQGANWKLQLELLALCSVIEACRILPHSFHQYGPNIDSVCDQPERSDGAADHALRRKACYHHRKHEAMQGQSDEDDRRDYRQQVGQDEVIALLELFSSPVLIGMQPTYHARARRQHRDHGKHERYKEQTIGSGRCVVEVRHRRARADENTAYSEEDTCGGDSTGQDGAQPAPNGFEGLL